MKVKNSLSLLLAALFAVGVLGSSVAYADEAQDHTTTEESTETAIVKLTDPEIAGAEEEEPDCE